MEVYTWIYIFSYTSPTSLCTNISLFLVQINECQILVPKEGGSQVPLLKPQHLPTIMSMSILILHGQLVHISM